MNIRRVKSYSSHIGVLIRAVLISKGPVCEVGAGLFSTPLLHWLCKEMDRRLVTYEDDKEFFELARRFKGRLHSIRKIENWDDMDFKGHWGVVLIDHITERRGQDTINFKDTTDYIVMHDTEPASCEAYGYNKVWQHFKYRFDWRGGLPGTSVVSNFYPLDEFGKKL